MQQHNRQFVFILTEVGKSSLLLQYTEERFQAEHQMTFGVEAAGHTLTINGHVIALEIWDTVRIPTVFDMVVVAHQLVLLRLAKKRTCLSRARITVTQTGAF